MTSICVDELMQELTQLPDSCSALLADVYEDYYHRCELGENPSVNDYVQKYPQIGGVIRNVFIALGEFEHQQAARLGVEASSTVPKTIAGCKILSQIGSGGMGVVYEAQHPTMSYRLAIKVLTEQGKFSEARQTRFLREAETAARLSHPNIVRFLDFGMDSELAYLSMWYVDGFGMEKILNEMIASESSIPPQVSGDPLRHEQLRRATILCSDYRSLAKIGADVAGALQHAHDNRIIHRDIKPANLILDTSGKIWVTDFGLAKAHSADSSDDLTKLGDIIGTPRYMAPEQIRGLCSTRSDIYSLGITLYELASRSKAWDNVSRHQLAKVRSNAELPDLRELAPQVPDELAYIIMKACALNPEERYETAAELRVVLTRFAEGQAKADRRRKARIDGQRYLRRKPLAIGLAVTAMVMLFSVGLWKLLSPPQPEDLISQLGNDEFLEKIIEDLPSALEPDDEDKKRRREIVAESASRAFEQTVEKYKLDEKSRDGIKQNVNKFVDAYRDGKIRQETMKDSVTLLKTSNLSAVLKIQNFGKRIAASGISPAEKAEGMLILQELAPAIVGQALPQETIDWLTKKIPDKRENLSAFALNAVVNDFLQSSLRALNDLEGMPKGKPASPERLAVIRQVAAERQQQTP